MVATSMGEEIAFSLQLAKSPTIRGSDKMALVLPILRAPERSSEDIQVP